MCLSSLFDPSLSQLAMREGREEECALGCKFSVARICSFCAQSPAPNIGIVYTVKSESESHLVLSEYLQPHGLYSPWNSLGQSTGVGSRSLL